MTCMCRAGLLVMRMCGEPMVAACTVCGKPVCQRHLAMGQAGAACAECAVMNPGFQETDETRMAETRAQYFGEPGTPQYGQGNYFTGTDAATLSQGVGQRRRRKDDEDDAYSS
jgi:hypothetical protein